MVPNGRLLTPQRPHAELLAGCVTGSEAYLQGALHDGTWNALHATYRFGPSDRRWLEVLSEILGSLGHRSWTYREGRDRQFWVLETKAPFLDVDYDASHLVGRPEGLAYVRGYFDAEGGMPKNSKARLYLQLCQKNRPNLETARTILESWGITCGRVHNPSRAVDPHYWRFYVRAGSHQRFMRMVGSWHPRKHTQMRDRLVAEAANSQPG